MTSASCVQALGIVKDTAWRDLNDLITQGYLQKAGTGRASSYLAGVRLESLFPSDGRTQIGRIQAEGLRRNDPAPLKKFADDSGHTAAEFYTNRTVAHLMTEMLEPQPGHPCHSKPPERRRKILFINAVDEVTRERARSFFADDHIERVVAAYREFADEPGFARVVAVQEICGKNANLKPALPGSTGKRQRCQQ